MPRTWRDCLTWVVLAVAFVVLMPLCVLFSQAREEETSDRS